MGGTLRESIAQLSERVVYSTAISNCRPATSGCNLGGGGLARPPQGCQDQGVMGVEGCVRRIRPLEDLGYIVSEVVQHVFHFFVVGPLRLENVCGWERKERDTNVGILASNASTQSHFIVARTQTVLSVPGNVQAMQGDTRVMKCKFLTDCRATSVRCLSHASVASIRLMASAQQQTHHNTTTMSRYNVTSHAPLPNAIKMLTLGCVGVLLGNRYVGKSKDKAVLP